MDSLPHKTASVMTCSACHVRYPQIRRSATRLPYCKECFYDAFEMDVHTTITNQKLFTPGDRVAIAISGGKDSTVLAHLMRTLNDKYHYELDMFLLAVDEGISGYRDDSLETVKRNEKQFNIPLKIVSYEQLYGWRMDQVVATVGKKNNCTFCGVFRRQALDRGAAQLGATKLCTGHNADDAAETVFMNILRGDIARIGRSPTTMTGHKNQFSLPRCKPLMFIYEKEIVLYAHFKKMDYFSTECTYAPNAYRGYTRDLIKHLEASNSQAILQILNSMSQLRYDVPATSTTPPGCCERCNWISSNTLCKCCVLLKALNSQNPQIAIVNKARREKLLKQHRSKHLCLSFACDATVKDKNVLATSTLASHTNDFTCKTCSCHQNTNNTFN